MEKNFNGKISESNVIKISAKDSRATSTVANYIDVILEFANFNPPYWLRNDKDTGEGYWWDYDSANNTVHILMAEKIRKEFIDLMKIRNNLTSEEKK